MYITEIEISDLKVVQDKGRVQGFVSFQCAAGQVQLHCAVSRINRSDSRDALVTEAIRQLERMPEFRAGARSLSFAPGILVADPAAA